LGRIQIQQQSKINSKVKNKINSKVKSKRARVPAPHNQNQEQDQ